MIGLCLLLAAAPIVLTDANAKQVIQVAVGEPIDIRLECNCGCCWQTVKRKCLTLNGPSTFEPDPKHPGPGAGRPEIQVVHLVMDKAGHGIVVLRYGRPFDQKDSDLRLTFRFNAKDGAK